MNLAGYIATLLGKSDCVIIPGFGGFITNPARSRIHEPTGEILPPARSVSFNAQLVSNDGLLYHEIASAEGIYYISAASRVAEELDGWMNILRERRNLAIEGVGKLVLTDDNRYVFQPSPYGLPARASYGLAPVQVLPVAQMNPEAAEPKIKKLETAVSTGSGSWIGRVAAACVIIAMVSAGIFYGYKNFVPNRYIIVDNAGVLSSQDSPSKALEKIIDSASAVSSVTNTAPVMHYYVIGGSFSREKNAKKFAGELQTKGYQATVLNNDAGFYRVAYLENSDSTAAGKSLEKIKVEENQAAWILKW